MNGTPRRRRAQRAIDCGYFSFLGYIVVLFSMRVITNESTRIFLSHDVVHARVPASSL